jgi:hypothetical protein
LKLGLPETATEAEALQKISELQNDKQSLQNQIGALNLSKITDLVDGAVTGGKITADKKEHFMTLGKAAGYESLKTTLEAFSNPVRPTNMLNLGNNGTETTTAKKWEDLSEQERIQLRAENWNGYVALFKNHYGFAPTQE